MPLKLPILACHVAFMQFTVKKVLNNGDLYFYLVTDNFSAEIMTVTSRFYQQLLAS